jgi:phage shock protein A
MDSTAFHELIAQVRGTRTALAEAEQKVTAVKAELAPQEHVAKLNATSRTIKPLPKRVSGWQPRGPAELK